MLSILGSCPSFNLSLLQSLYATRHKCKGAHKHAYIAGKKILMKTRENEVKKLKGEGKKEKSSEARLHCYFKAKLLFCLAKCNKSEQVGHGSVSPADTVPALFRFLRVNELALKESFKEPC